MIPELSGILLIDKPKGLTSHDVVGRIRRILRMKAVGHCGTLDPMATGLMVIVLGAATKISQFLLNGNKTYQAEICFGYETETLDLEGEKIWELQAPEKLQALTERAVREQVEKLSGRLNLEIPLFSAKKVQGKKLYEYARSGEKIELPRKDMNFFDVQLLAFQNGTASVRLSCEKGGFIRAWSKALGRNLEVGATLVGLRRLDSEPWKLKSAVTLEQLEEITQQSSEGSLASVSGFVPIERSLPHMKVLLVDQFEKKLLSHGQIAHSVSARLIPDAKQAAASSQSIGIQVFDRSRSQLLAVIQATPERGLKIKRVFS